VPEPAVPPRRSRAAFQAPLPAATPARVVTRTEAPVARPASVATAAAAPAPEPAPATTPAPAPDQAPTATAALAEEKRDDPSIEQTGCTTCGGFHSNLNGPSLFHNWFSGCADGQCIPGRPPCDAPYCGYDSLCGQFFANLYQMICCPDPCYKPIWDPAANASFFVDYARPRTVTRIRYDNLNNILAPDRNQYFFQQLGNGMKHGGPGTGRPVIWASPWARLQQVYLYQEAAGQRGSFFVEMPYRQVNSIFPTTAGFGDLNFGIKSLLVDCEVLQLTFQFKTYTPTGNGMAGLGTGNFNLEPSLLTALKLTPTTFFQGQFGNWIPLGGKQNLAGGIWLTYMSLNQVLWEWTPSSPLIGTLEMDIWSFENGGYTLPGGAPKSMMPTIRSSGGGVSYFNIGPGLRQSICNKLDLGAAITWATTSPHWGDPWFRCEIRFLF
jgi:hypothetical protein